MAEGYFSSRGEVLERDCRTCHYSIGTTDGHHLWCQRARKVVVCPCGLWAREAGADEEAATAPG
jgi:predicted oxidoreductase